MKSNFFSFHLDFASNAKIVGVILSLLFLASFSKASRPIPVEFCQRISRLVATSEWLSEQTMEDVVAIEKSVSNFPWTRERFLHTLRTSNSIGMVVKDKSGKTIGYLVYELGKNEIIIRNLGVAKEYQNKKVGTLLVEHLKSKLSLTERHTLKVQLRASQKMAQNFFQQLGFKELETRKHHYQDTGEHAVVLQYAQPGSGTRVEDGTVPKPGPIHPASEVDIDRLLEELTYRDI